VVITAKATPQAPAEVKGTPMRQAVVDVPAPQNP
jgi:hypothetical protein